jgi:hypothetical protein
MLFSHGPVRAKGNNEISLYREAEIGHRLEHEIPKYEAAVLSPLQEWSVTKLSEAKVAESTT